MLVRKATWVLVAVFAAVCMWGCGKGGDEKRIGELLTRQEDQALQMTKMSGKIDSMDEKLSGVERSLSELLGGQAGTGKGPELLVSSSFASTQEYQDIQRQIAALLQQTSAATSELQAFQQQEKEAQELAQLRDRGAAWRAMGDPKELSRRLDLLAQNFSGKIQDPGTKARFMADIDGLRAKYSVELTPQQKLEAARTALTESLNTMEDERARGFLERQLQELDQNPGTPEAADRVDRIYQMQRMREIGELTQAYNIPGDTVTDSGLVSFGGRGGPGGAGGPGGLGRAQGRGQRGRGGAGGGD
jgi:DNA repair exonuclease SbcCD ATPase subunit